MRKFIFLITCLLLALCMVVRASENEINSLKGKYLIVLDVQEFATRRIMNEKDAEKLIQAINSIIDLCDPEKVIYIESISAKLEISLSGLSVKFDEGLRLDNRLKVVSHNLFVKNKANSFTSEGFLKFIQETNAHDFVVVGLMAEHCVIETLNGGEELGYKMYFIPGAIATESEDEKKVVLSKAENNGIERMELNDLIFNN